MTELTWYWLWDPYVVMLYWFQLNHLSQKSIGAPIKKLKIPQLTLAKLAQSGRHPSRTQRVPCSIPTECDFLFAKFILLPLGRSLLPTLSILYISKHEISAQDLYQTLAITNVVVTYYNSPNSCGLNQVLQCFFIIDVWKIYIWKQNKAWSYLPYNTCPFFHHKYIVLLILSVISQVILANLSILCKILVRNYCSNRKMLQIDKEISKNLLKYVIGKCWCEFLAA